MNQREYRTLILAGLLHDVGKLLRKQSDTIQKEKPYGRSKSGEAKPQGTHATDGASYLKWLEENRLLSRFGIDAPTLLDVTFHHHNKQRKAAWLPGSRLLGPLLSQADWYSSKERPDDVSQQVNTLECIFQNVDIGFHRRQAERYYRPRALEMNDSVPFPETDVPLHAGTDEFNRLVGGFEGAFERLLQDHESFDTLIPSLLSLLERFTWCVSSQPQSERLDVSLYDHVRTTSAIAACLYAYHHHQGTLDEVFDRHPSPGDQYEEQKAALEREERLRLVGGDLSGIQDYLYDIANVGAGGVAKRLRARSFYLSALVEVVAHRLLDDLVPECTLPLSCVLLSSGGRFTLLAPNLPAVEENLSHLDAEINAWLRGIFHGDLAFVFEDVTLGGGAFAIKETAKESPTTILDKFIELEDRLRERKQRKLHPLLVADRMWNEGSFLQEDVVYARGRGDCPSCRKLPALAAPSHQNLAEGAEPTTSTEGFCAACEKDRIIGERLLRTTHVAYYHRQPFLEDAELQERTIAFFDGDQRRYAVLMDRAQGHSPGHEAYLVDNLADTELTARRPDRIRHLANYVPYFGSRTDFEKQCQTRCPHKAKCETRAEIDREDRFPTIQRFECIAAASGRVNGENGPQYKGSELLGVLRMDVDWLGLILAQGLGPYTSISRLATLSRMVDLFFGGWVHTTLERRYRDCYTVYSGGDDLLIVGPWDSVIDLTQHVSSEFRRYTAENPNMTLSAAIAVTKPRFPIAKAARRAGEWLEDRAKEEGRNRLHLFGTTTVWRLGEPAHGETVSAAELLDDWARFLDDQLAAAETVPGYPFSTNAAHRLLRYAEMCRRWQDDASIHAEELLWLSQLEYDLARNIRPESVPEMDERLREVRTKLRELGLNRRDVMGKLRMPITYALLRHRERRI